MPAGGPPVEAPQVPQWAKDAVFYQIFPDRFARSPQVPKPSNLLAWDDPPSDEGYHGGDLLGIVEHLDYLVDLGVTGLYLTPIFQSASNHRYHTHDYEKVDPLLGGNRALKTLVEQCHQRGLRLVLDGVFNHASRGFLPFNDILEHGPHSPWIDWFIIEGWPLSAYDGSRPANYVSWKGNRALPKFNTDNPEVRAFLMGIAELWVRDYGIDGWRLDVPAEIETPGFWEEFRRRVRRIRPDAYLIGEIWHEAPEWLRGDRFDATMNYGFAAATLAFAAAHRISPTLPRGRSYNPYPGIDAQEFAARIDRLVQAYHWETVQVQFNLIGSHDAPRPLSLARGDRASVRLATLMQMCFPGTPCIYYGDEIALRGTTDYDGPHHDRDARWPFPWHDTGAWDRQMLDFFRKAIALRRAHPALRRGTFRRVYAERQCFGFLREEASEQLLVVLNAGDDPHHVELDMGALPGGRLERPLAFGSVDALRETETRIEMAVPGRQGIVARLVA